LLKNALVIAYDQKTKFGAFIVSFSLSRSKNYRVTYSNPPPLIWQNQNGKKMNRSAKLCSFTTFWCVLLEAG